MRGAVPALLLLTAIRAAGDPAPMDHGDTERASAGRGGWQAGTTPRPAPPPPGQSRLQVRTYDGLNSLGPLYGHRDGVLAVDVTAELLVCPDGSRIVTALVIGGMRHALDNTCRADGRRAPVQADAAPRRPVIRCSAEAWNCRPVP